MSSSSELACVYAALLLADDEVEVSGDNIKKVIEAAKIEGVEGYLPGLFAKALDGVDVNTLVANIGSGGGGGGGGGGGAAAPAAADAGGAAPAAEAKKEESEEGSDESMGGLFD